MVGARPSRHPKGLGQASPAERANLTSSRSKGHACCTTVADALAPACLAQSVEKTGRTARDAVSGHACSENGLAAVEIRNTGVV